MLYNNTYIKGSYVTGSNLGMYSSVKPKIDTFFIYNPNPDVNLRLLISVLGYAAAGMHFLVVLGRIAILISRYSFILSGEFKILLTVFCKIVFSVTKTKIAKLDRKSFKF